VNGRILFVDDDPDLLSGLRNLLRRQRHRWDMVFASGGGPGLEALAKGAFDVVVSDIRMPGMDGPEFLRHVRDRYPETARIVLSGQADHAAFLSILGTAQLYLSKPCPAEMLVATLEKCLATRQVVAAGEVRRAIGGMDRLYSPPEVYSRLAELAATGASGEQIASVIRADAGTSVKLLQIVNSAYFGPRTSILSVGRAIAFLGVETVKAVVLTSETFCAAANVRQRQATFDFEATAAATARLAQRMSDSSPAQEEAFTAGLLHDLGRLVLATTFPDAFARASDLGRLQLSPWQERERETMGVTHAEVGGYLLGAWGLPTSIVSSATHHHEPSAVAPNDVLEVVHIADALVHAALGRGHEAPLDEVLLDRRGLRGKLAGWAAMAHEETAAVASGFSRPSAVASHGGSVAIDDTLRTADGLHGESRPA
jgi:HD-like signal output (HDOD) protein/CheY-like chemotaxis protein